MLLDAAKDLEADIMLTNGCLLFLCVCPKDKMMQTDIKMDYRASML